jgi:hypothetical protein
MTISNALHGGLFDSRAERKLIGFNENEESQVRAFACARREEFCNMRSQHAIASTAKIATQALRAQINRKIRAKGIKSLVRMRDNQRDGGQRRANAVGTCTTIYLALRRQTVRLASQRHFAQASPGRVQSATAKKDAISRSGAYKAGAKI